MKKDYAVVEFPGYGKVEKLVEMCGGIPRISYSLKSSSSLQLSLRPDIFSKPIHGEVLNTGNILLKIIKQTNTRTGEISLAFKIMGIVSKTIRFRALADYQYTPNPMDTLVQLRMDLDSWDVSKIENFRFSHEMGQVDDLRNIPPPAFTSTQWSLDYGYKQNPAVVKVMLKDQDSEHFQIINRHRKHQRLIASVLNNLKQENVPSGPPEAFKPSESVPADAIAQITKIFNSKPIWSRPAIINNLKKNYRRYIHQLLPRTAYLITKGAWRDCWVKYGYDPRKNPESAAYQIVLLRRTARRELSRGKRVKKQRELTEQVIDDNSHIFEGKNVPKLSAFQLCDIKDSEISAFIKSHQSTRQKCSKHSGWYSRKFINVVRKMLVRKVNKITGMEDDESDIEYDGLSEESIESSDDESEKEEEDIPVDDDLAQTEERVKSKVESLMRNLQSTQLDQDAEFPEDADEYDKVIKKMLSPKNSKDVRVLLLDPLPIETNNSLEIANYHVEECFTQLSEADLTKKISEFNIVCLGHRNELYLTDEVLRSAHRLLAIGVFGRSAECVDLSAARSMGIPVFCSPYQHQHSVSELIIANIILLARQLGDRSMEIHNGIWNKISRNCVEVRNKTLGIVGYGHVGSQLGVMAEALSLRVIFYDSISLMPIGRAMQMDSLNSLLAESDFVSINVSCIPENDNLFNKSRFDVMKKGSFLINCSHENAINLPDLAEAIKSQHLGGAAIDVFPNRPSVSNSKFTSCLQNLPNVILSSSIAADTTETEIRRASEVTNSVVQYIKYGTTIGAVNFPSISAWPLKDGQRRIINMHRNVRGVLKEIDFILSAYNVGKQVLDTKDGVGYFIADVQTENVMGEIVSQLAMLANSIKTRVI